MRAYFFYLSLRRFGDPQLQSSTTMNETAILERLDSMTSAFVAYSRLVGARLSRAEMCERLDVCSKTLTHRVRKGEVPSPAKDGKWLLAEVIEWEAGRR